ncbi:MAG: DUF2330 domain-containing protein [Deltaproteobacteria bacterium]|nr:DUF2330 domain-containing protein [Deltaproteobacteria bacterium]
MRVHLPVLLSLLLLPASGARADGLVVYHAEIGPAEAVAVEADAQRAALWFRDGAWELTIQPSFPRGAGAAAWLVPFPVVPEVSGASAGFLDALETLSAPVFVPYCVEEAGGGRSFFGCGGAAGGGGDARTGPAASGVTLWAAGTTGALEWVVLEAPGAAALLDWLSTEGYLAPPAVEEAPELLDGQVVFAAKLTGAMDPDEPLPPMTFRLPGVAYGDVTYPLRLTAAVAPEEGTELLLWVILPQDAAPLVPRSVRWLPHTGPGDTTLAQWEADVEVLRAALPPAGGLVLEYAGRPGIGPLFLRAPLVAPGGWTEVLPADAGLELPEAWPGEVEELGQDGAVVLRLRGRLTAAAMAGDLGFQPAAEGEIPALDAIHWHEVPCSAIPGAPAAADAGPLPRRGAGLALLALLGGLLLLRRVS